MKATAGRARWQAGLGMSFMLVSLFVAALRLPDAGATPAQDTASGSTVTIVNASAPDESTEFPFVGPDGRFVLVDDQAQTFDGLAPGPFVVTRSPLPDWQLTSVECVDDNGGPTSSVNVSDGTVTIDVIAGDEVTCTFATVKTEIIDPAIVEASTTTTIGTEIIEPALVEAATTTTTTATTTTATTTTATTTTATSTTSTLAPASDSGPGESGGGVAPDESDETEVAGAVLLPVDATIQLGSVVVDVGDVCAGQDDPTLWVDGEQVPTTADGSVLRMDGTTNVLGEVSIAVRCGEGPIVAEGVALLGAPTSGPGGSSATVVIVAFFFLAVLGAVIVPGLLGGAANGVGVKD